MIWTENTESKEDKDREIQRLTELVKRLEKKNKELQKRSDELGRLEAAGVDNWEGYSYGREDEEDDEDGE